MVSKNIQPKLTLEQASSHILVADAMNKAISEYDCHDSIVKPFAQGGLGVIFTVMNCNTEEVLLKVPSYGRRCPDEYWLLEHSLAKEAAILKELSCEAVPALIKTDGTGKYLFREFAVGQRLADLHKKSKVSNESKKEVLTSLFKATRQLFNAFHEHEKGCFVIRDFKPVNLILSDKDVGIRLVDVGSTRPESDMLSKTTRPYRVGSGKWRHWAPEQLMEKSECLDRRADYFSLGSTVYFVMTAKNPYKNIEPDRNKVVTTYQKDYPVISETLARMGDSIQLLPKAVDFIESCLSPIPSERPSLLPDWFGNEPI